MNIVTRDSELAGEHRLFGKRGYDKILALRQIVLAKTNLNKT